MCVCLNYWIIRSKPAAAVYLIRRNIKLDKQKRKSLLHTKETNRTLEKTITENFGNPKPGLDSSLNQKSYVAEVLQ